MQKDYLLKQNYYYFIVIVVFLIVFPAKLCAEEKDTVYWTINDAQPFYIVEGELKGQGFGDRIQSMIISHMKSYNHVVLNRPLKRVLLEMESQKPRCFSTWIYNTRDDIVVTSAPYLYYQPHGVVLLKETSKKLQNPKTLAFNELLQNTDYIFGKPLGRGYGIRLDPILEQHESTANIFKGAGKSTEGIFRMLQAGRIHYTIEYPYTMEYYADKLDLQDSLDFIPLVENQKSILLGAVACTKTSWGKSVIKDMNKVIVQIRELPEYKKIIQDWFVLQGRENEYWEVYQQEVISRSE